MLRASQTSTSIFTNAQEVIDITKHEKMSRLKP